MIFVIPFFIPHRGCPHQCLFCNQNSITGKESTSVAIEKEIEATLVEWLARRQRAEETHFAFYGGSFSCLSKNVQYSMLKVLQPWLENGEIDAVRISTRPDCIDEERCNFLVAQGVRIVELGVQSLDNKVLMATRRGHNENDCIRAVHHLQKASLQVGIQLMPGLPEESRSSFMRTVKETVRLHPSFVRLYPALVVANSELAHMYKRGDYSPLSLQKAIVLTAWARRVFLSARIKVIRMGLQASESLEENLLAGPYHPAFGELVVSRIWLQRTRRLLAKFPGEKLQLTVSPRDLSAFYGRKKMNIKRLNELGLATRFEITVDNHLKRGEIKHVVCE